MKPKRVCEIFLKFQPSNTITTHPPFLQNYYKILILLSFLLPFTKTNHYLPLQETCGNKYSRLHENYFRGKRELPMIRTRLLKRRNREVKVDPKLGGQWKVPYLVANGMFKAWWPLEGSMLGGHWKVPCLVAIGRFHAWSLMEGEGKNTFSPLPFSPYKLYLNLQFFSFDLTILFYHGLKSLLTFFFFFFRSINYDYAPQCNKSFTPSLSI
jgi:hypothetical protein